MSNNEAIQPYTLEEFYMQKKLIIKQIEHVIKSKKRYITDQDEKAMKKDLLRSKNKDVITLVASGAVVSVSALFLSKIETGNSYLISFGCPSLVILSSFLVSNKLKKDESKIEKDMELMRFVYAYENLIKFINGNENLVSSLNEIREICISDKFFVPLRILNSLDKFNMDDYVYVEELCVDFNIHNKNEVKKLVKDK